MIFLIAVQAELTQTPFDMPIAESELVAGYMVEYTGIRFLVYFIAEFATAVGFAAIASTLFLGGWALPGQLGHLPTARCTCIGPIVIIDQDGAADRRRLLGPLQLPPLP